MNRRSNRLSGQLDSSPPSSSIELLSGGRLLTTSTNVNAAAGPSSRATGTTDTLSPSTPLEDWPLAALQAEVKRYGFKVSRKRSTLIDQLKAVYEALQRSQVTNSASRGPIDADIPKEPPKAARAKRKLILPESSTASETAAKAKGKGRKSDPYVLDISSDSDQPSSPIASGVQANEEAGDYTLQLELEALSATDGSDPSSPDTPLSTTSSPVKSRRARSRSLSSSPDIPLATSLAEEEELAVEPTPALATTMTTAIRSNPALWDRILKYEPISFDEFVSVATQSGLSMAAGKSKEELRTWLDRQCICHYSNDLTGPRSRH